MYVCASPVYQVPEEARREHWIPWDWNQDVSYYVGAGRQTLGLLEEQLGLLTIEPSLVNEGLCRFGIYKKSERSKGIMHSRS